MHNDCHVLFQDDEIGAFEGMLHYYSVSIANKFDFDAWIRMWEGDSSLRLFNQLIDTEDYSKIPVVIR